MKTNLERRFEKLMTRHLAFADIPAEDRAQYMYDFFVNSEVYYDNLCDLLYSASIRETAPDESLWIRPNGYVYRGVSARAEEDLLVMYSNEVPVFSQDISLQLESAFLRIYRLHLP